MSTILLSTTTPVQAQTVDSLTIARELEIEKVEVTGVVVDRRMVDIETERTPMVTWRRRLAKAA
jgi:hypothetical protein